MELTGYLAPFDHWEFDTNSKECSPKEESECNTNKENEQNEAELEYQKFLRSLGMPIDQETGNTNTNENEDDPDFVLNENDYKSLDIDPKNTVNTSKPPRIPLPSTVHKIECTQQQLRKIQNLMSDHFQLLVQIRHLTIDKKEYVNEHEITTDLLYDLHSNKENAHESIRSTLETNYFSTYRRTRNLSNHFTNDIFKNMIIKTAFNINGMDEYFAFNKGVLKSLKQNLKHFEQNNIRMNKKYKPPFMTIPTTKKTKKNSKKRKKKATPHFSKRETELMELAMKEYGQTVSTKESGMMCRGIPDWNKIQKRYFPHRDIRFLQLRLGRLRAKLKTVDKSINDFDNFGRMRAKAKKMNDADRKLLLKGIEIFGLSDWASISRQLLPNWERRELRKIWLRKIKPSLKENEELALMTKFHEKSDPRTNGNTKKSCHYDYEETLEFPQLNHFQEVEILNDEYKLNSLRSILNMS
eukprot:161822_1